MMRTLADPNPQHWLPEHVEHHLTVNQSLRSVRFSEVSKLDTGVSAQGTILHCTSKDDENLRPVYKNRFRNIEWLLPFWTFKFLVYEK
jgi:hypothetical protein